jgi:hypothetical protein
LSSVRPWLALALLPLSSGCGSDRVANPVADAGLALELRSALASTVATTSESVAAESGTGWGSLKGRFVFAGAAGDPRVLVVDKDTEVCSKEGVKLLDRSLLVDGSSKGVANVVIFARKTGRVRNPVPDTTLVFDQKNCEFLAPVFAARVGQPIDVRNSDPIGHNTNIAGTSFNQLIPAGAGTVYKADAETGMPTMVTCNIHPWMKAWLVVRTNPYAAVSNADGSFEIKNVPAGEVELQMWHEKAGYIGEINVGGKAEKTAKGRKKVKVEAGETDLGEITLGPDLFKK